MAGRPDPLLGCGLMLMVVSAAVVVAVVALLFVMVVWPWLHRTLP